MMKKPKPKKKCGQCGPLPGLLFPMNDSPEVQACDECNIYESDEKAAEALLAFLKAGNVHHVYLRATWENPAHGGWANLGVAGNDLTLHSQIDGHELDWMLYETGWMTSIHHRVKEIQSKAKAKSRLARSIISLVTVHRDEAETRACDAREKYDKLAQIKRRVVKAAGLAIEVYVVVETEKE